MISTLGDVASVRMGYPFRARLENDPIGGIAVIQMKDLDDANMVRVHGAARVTIPTPRAHHLLRAGDLLFRSRGRNYAAAQVLEGIGTAVVAAPLLRIRPTRVLPAYLNWYLNTASTQAALAAKAEGTAVLMISAEALKAVPVPCPSMRAQEEIVQAAALDRREHALATRIADRRHQLHEHQLLAFAHEATR